MKSEDAIWISKDGRRLAFLKLNDTKVTSISYQKIDNSAEQPASLKYAKVSPLAGSRNRNIIKQTRAEQSTDLPTDGLSDEICVGGSK